MQFTYRPSGVCSRAISFELEDGRLHNVRFQGGCAGNTAGIASLVEGMTPEEVTARLSGIRCGFRPTSCPDQLARALQQAMAQVRAEK